MFDWAVDVHCWLTMPCTEEMVEPPTANTNSNQFDMVVRQLEKDIGKLEEKKWITQYLEKHFTWSLRL